MGRRPVSLEQRFWAKVVRGGPDDCWLWTAYRDKDGYGQIAVDTSGKQDQAHRISLTWRLGRPLKPGYVARHTCDNPPCVNPAHLIEDTIDGNNKDRQQKGRSATGDKNGMRLSPELLSGEKNGNAALSDDIARKIRQLYAAGGVTQKALADRYGITEPTVWKIVNDRSYVRAA